MLMTSLETFKESEKEVKEKLKTMVSDEIETMDSKSLETIRSMLKFMDSTTTLIEEQTKAIDTMNKKLDEILRRA